MRTSASWPRSRSSTARLRSSNATPVSSAGSVTPTGSRSVFGERHSTTRHSRFIKTYGDRIWGLYLANTGVTDDGLRSLAGLSHIETLAIGNLDPRQRPPGIDDSPNAITDAGLVHLKDLKSLRNLTLGGLPITDAGLEALKDLPNLGGLYLYGTRVRRDRNRPAQVTTRARRSLPRWQRGHRRGPRRPQRSDEPPGAFARRRSHIGSGPIPLESPPQTELAGRQGVQAEFRGHRRVPGRLPVCEAGLTPRPFTPLASTKSAAAFGDLRQIPRVKPRLEMSRTGERERGLCTAEVICGRIVTCSGELLSWARSSGSDRVSRNGDS